MNQRSKDILIATVKEYIRTGDPISSKSLFDDYDFGIKPASIRAELNSLEEAGWLEQPHVSGGRVPTDKALEFFTEVVRKELYIKPRQEKNIVCLVELIIEGELKSFVNELSRALHLLSAGFDEQKLAAHTSGLDELFNCVEFSDSKIYYEIAKDVECLGARMAELIEDAHDSELDGPTVFIGKKSPLIRNDEITTVFDIFDLNDNRMLFATFGPRSMNYRKNFGAFITLRKELKNINNYD